MGKTTRINRILDVFKILGAVVLIICFFIFPDERGWWITSVFIGLFATLILAIVMELRK